MTELGLVAVALAALVASAVMVSLVPWSARVGAGLWLLAAGLVTIFLGLLALLMASHAGAQTRQEKTYVIERARLVADLEAKRKSLPDSACLPFHQSDNHGIGGQASRLPWAQLGQCRMQERSQHLR